MKKNILKFIMIITALVPFVGCTSTKISISELSPVAVISITGNSQIPWVDENPDEYSSSNEPEAESYLTNLVYQTFDSNNPELLTARDRLDYAFDSVNQNFPDLIGCDVVPKEKVLSSEIYEDLTPSYFNKLTSTKSATGFKDLSIIGAKTARMFMNSVGANSVLQLSFTFQKDILKGTRTKGEICGIVTMKAKLLNNHGKEILNRIYSSKTSGIKISSGDYDRDILISNLNEEIDTVVRQFCMDLSKMSVESY